MSIKANNLVWRIGRKTILQDVSFSAKPGKMLGLLGPNGSGKTSLRRLLASLKTSHSGSVMLDDRDIRGIGRKAMAQRIGFVEQHATTNSNLAVIDVVSWDIFCIALCFLADPRPMIWPSRKHLHAPA